MSERPQSIGLTGVVNARELGGYPTLDGTTVKKGLLIRSGELNLATDEDVRILAEDYHLGTIIDLREPAEITKHPNVEIDGVVTYVYDVKATEASAEEVESEEAESKEEIRFFENVYLNYAAIFQSWGVNVKATYAGLYKDLVTNEPAINGIRGVFKAMLEAEEGEAVLFHCSAGKDRTGVPAAIILSALNVDREIIYQDFLLTNEFTADTIDEHLAAAAKETDDEYLLDQTRLLVAVDKAYLDYTFDAIDNEYGGMDAFLTDIVGISEENLAALRSKYTE